MKTRYFLQAALSVALSPLLISPATAQNALDDVMARKLITHRRPHRLPALRLRRHRHGSRRAWTSTWRSYIAAKLGVKVELVPVTSANRIPYLQTKKADLVISTLGKNPEREKVIDFTAAYAPFFQAVFAAKTLTRQELRRPGRQDASP